MGCDIHLYTERKFHLRDRDVWFCTDYLKQNVYHLVDPDEKEYEHISIFDDRNYELFYMLAGVRDGDYEPIDEPRDLPQDVSDYVKAQSDYWGCDGHSHSYYTAKEIFAAKKKFPDSSIKFLAKAIKKKMADEFNIWDFLSKEEKKQRDKAFAEDFRIVFWFDN